MFLNIMIIHYKKKSLVEENDFLISYYVFQKYICSKIMHVILCVYIYMYSKNNLNIR